LKLGERELSQDDVTQIKHKILSMQISNIVDPILHELEDIDTLELIKKLLYYTVQKEGIGSFEAIGYEKEAVDAMYQEYIREEKATKRKSRRRK